MAMASVKIKNIGVHQVGLREPKNPCKKFDLVVLELVFTDARGASHRSKFALEDLLAALGVEEGKEIVVDVVFTKDDKFEIVR
jgi:hypothetical protein